MEYTIQKLALLAGVSTRTLRYYDEIGILKPARINSSGYRLYGRKEVDVLQQILFYRELGLHLDGIKEVMAAPDFNELEALGEHREMLLEKRKQLDALIFNVEKTIMFKERKMIMSDQEKFEGFKDRLIEENERTYGKEIREKYGDERVDFSNSRLKNATKEELAGAEQLGEDVLETLFQAYQNGDPAGELAQKAADLHRQWLSFYWGSYSKEAHAGLAQMYVDDERFTAYYDKKQPGLTKFLRDAVVIYTK
jgi:DNA-binding transcriptional MerR regulator